MKPNLEPLLAIQITATEVRMMTRAAVEAHLLLNGWQGFYYGMGAAMKETGDEWTVLYLRNAARNRVEVHDARLAATEKNRQKINDSPYPWGHIGNDDNFCLLANACLREDRDPFPF